ncbi:sulfite exporter TauE/SafE family protein [Rhizobiaceae bacterium n13]|uniref:Probable membrane transporter protein n=1 Tax=Ferirhizobium litorale TaxID=2927786 RepID=A0AAE3QKW3_9HYPH|nr:sulfite exporter TauE/SafE family protein [Fererhizobium litorale]MDI7864904.1 sulfite exporter TauE/SafE family protein [Fererhizobium litorale]MDI7925024.1 sulfite exporter TauE/SafE family protein [Fererhizobium litorale]
MPPISELMMFAALLAIAGGIAGLLAGLFGIGGGAILVPVFYQVFGLIGVDEAVRMHLSVGTSLAIIVPTSLRSFLAHLKHGAVDLDLLKGWTIAVPLGAVIAAVIASEASSETLRIIFAAIALLVAFRMIFNRESWRLGSDLPPNPAKFLVGTGIGVLSGLMGVGGGVLNNTFMSLYGRTMHQAVATSAGVGVLISIPGLFGYVWAGWGDAGLPPFSSGFINWVAVFLIIPVTMIAAPYGAQLAHTMSKRQLETGFGIFMVLIALRFVYSIWG